jgi:hypothetical protein
MGTLEILANTELFLDMKFPDRFMWPDAGVTLDEGWLQKPTCEGCWVAMVPVGRGGWWCEACQEFQ